jgi:hypothetical protein
VKQSMKNKEEKKKEVVLRGLKKLRERESEKMYSLYIQS